VCGWDFSPALVGSQEEARRDHETRLAAARAAWQEKIRRGEAQPFRGGGGLPEADGEEYTNSIGMVFVPIPAGSFVRRGSPNIFDEVDFTVTLSQPFYLGKYPVTQEQWVAVMETRPPPLFVQRLLGRMKKAKGLNPSQFRGRHRPVENVSWDDAQEFIQLLNQKEGCARYRLPTDAEWEYACRAGSTWMNNGKDYAWCKENSENETHPVGEKKPNAWGLHDMIGNVSEWVQDWCGAYPGESVTDPAGPSSGSHRVLRGGNWACDLMHCDNPDSLPYSRQYGPSGSSPKYAHCTVGFRLAFFPE
jgi:formylglycine-generating enzyme required for sulfatase activity